MCEVNVLNHGRPIIITPLHPYHQHRSGEHQLHADNVRGANERSLPVVVRGGGDGTRQTKVNRVESVSVKSVERVVSSSKRFKNNSLPAQMCLVRRGDAPNNADAPAAPQKKCELFHFVRLKQRGCLAHHQRDHHWHHRHQNCREGMTSLQTSTRTT